MKFLLTFVLFFGLPHADWFPRRFGISPEAIPLGVTNLLLLLALFLWILGHLLPPAPLKNPFPVYRYFLFVAIFGVLIALFSGYEESVLEILTLSKREISLLFLYFVPLAIIKNEDDFKKFFLICLLVHFLVGVEVLRSGVLGGENFADHKRGSGPFSWGWQASDVAGSYLAQVLMYFLAFLFVGKEKIWKRIVIVSGAVVIIAGIYATYARGAMLAAILGVLFMVMTKGFNAKYLLLPILLALILFITLPQSIKTRFIETTTESGELDQSSQGRVALNLAGFTIAKEHLLGVGTGQLRSAMREYTGNYVDCHNSYLYTAAELGVVGLCIFFYMFYVFFRAVRRIYATPDIPVVYRIYAVGTGGMIGAFLGCNLFYANFYKDLVMGTIVIHWGMLAYVFQSCRGRQEEQKAKEHK